MFTGPFSQRKQENMQYMANPNRTQQIYEYGHNSSITDKVQTHEFSSDLHRYFAKLLRRPFSYITIHTSFEIVRVRNTFLKN